MRLKCDITTAKEDIAKEKEKIEAKNKALDLKQAMLDYKTLHRPFGRCFFICCSVFSIYLRGSHMPLLIQHQI